MNVPFKHLWIILFIAAGTLSGCQDAVAENPPTYQVRGIIQNIVELTEYPAGLVIAHESVDDFRDREGKIVGMEAMIMNFTLSKDLSAEALNVGDEILFTFQVNWNTGPRLLITDIDKKSSPTS